MNNLRITISNKKEKGYTRVVENNNVGTKPKGGSEGRNNGQTVPPRPSANARLMRNSDVEPATPRPSANQRVWRNPNVQPATPRRSANERPLRNPNVQPARPRRSANERLLRKPDEPAKVTDLREKLINNNEAGGDNNNEAGGDVEMVDVQEQEIRRIQAPRRIGTTHPDCICVRELKMVLCR